MKTHIRIILALLAGVGGIGTVTAQTNAAPPQDLRSFVATDAPGAALIAESQRARNYRPPCTRSTFSELGHGHADVAEAGYASNHCPSYEQTADASNAKRL